MLVQIIRVLCQFTSKATHEVINICNDGIKRFHRTLDLHDCFLYPWIFPNHLFLKTEVAKVVVEIGVYKEYIRPKTFHHVLSPPKQENVQIEAPSACNCNYPICCFRSASRSSRGSNRWILFVHSSIHSIIQSKFINCVFAIFPGAGSEEILTWVFIIETRLR